jgi:hypothetical protein
MPRDTGLVLVRRPGAVVPSVSLRPNAVAADRPVRLISVTNLLPPRPTIILRTRPPAAVTSAPGSAPAAMAPLMSRVERIAETSTLRIERQPLAWTPNAPSIPGPVGPPGAPGRPGADGAPGMLARPRSDLVVRAASLPAGPTREVAMGTTSAPAATTPEPAVVPSSPTPPMPSVADLTTEVIRGIERRATAQRERLARPPRG